METQLWADAQSIETDYEDLYEHAPCGYISTLPDGMLVKANHTFCAWLGYERADLVGRKRLQELLPVAGKIYYETHYLPLLRMQGYVNEIAFDLVCRDGQRLPVLLNTVDRRDENGVPVVCRTTIFGSTDRRQYERELQLARTKAEQALMLRDQFLSLASHELKTPLTTILGHVQLLQRRIGRDDALNARDQRAVEVIADQTKRLHKLILELLDVSRIETGQLLITRQPLDLAALIRRIVEETQMTLDGRSIELHSPDGPLVIEGDELRLEQVFQNLIQNAMKYSDATAPVRVTLSTEDHYVYVAVEDVGIGIPQAAMGQLFERFYRASNAHSINVGGMGIGLYVVKQIVEQHHGEVAVTSVEDQGSTFSVRLPLASS
jgi:PAS domain S-box-containing protein